MRDGGREVPEKLVGAVVKRWWGGGGRAVGIAVAGVGDRTWRVVPPKRVRFERLGLLLVGAGWREEVDGKAGDGAVGASNDAQTSKWSDGEVDLGGWRILERSGEGFGGQDGWELLSKGEEGRWVEAGVVEHVADIGKQVDCFLDNKLVGVAGDDGQ